MQIDGDMLSLHGRAQFVRDCAGVCNAAFPGLFRVFNRNAKFHQFFKNENQYKLFQMKVKNVFIAQTISEISLFVYLFYSCLWLSHITTAWLSVSDLGMLFQVMVQLRRITSRSIIIGNKRSLFFSINPVLKT